MTNFPNVCKVAQNYKPLARAANKFLIDRSIGKILTRPFAYSLMTLDPFVPDTRILKRRDTYTSWDSLTDRRYTRRHLPPIPS